MLHPAPTLTVCYGKHLKRGDLVICPRLELFYYPSFWRTVGVEHLPVDANDGCHTRRRGPDNKLLEAALADDVTC